MILDVEPVLQAMRARLTNLDPDQPAGLVQVLAELDATRGPIEGLPLEPEPGSHQLGLIPTLYALEGRSRIEADHYPAVLLVPQDTPQVVPVDAEVAAETFRTDYVVRTWVLVRAHDHETAGAGRSRLAAGVAEAFHRAPRLRAGVGAPTALDALTWSSSWPDDEVTAAVLNPRTLRASWSDVVTDETDQRSVAGVWLQWTVQAMESTATPPLSDPDADLEPVVAVHPALAD